MKYAFVVLPAFLVVAQCSAQAENWQRGYFDVSSELTYAEAARLAGGPQFTGTETFKELLAGVRKNGESIVAWKMLFDTAVYSNDSRQLSDVFTLCAQILSDPKQTTTRNVRLNINFAYYSVQGPQFEVQAERVGKRLFGKYNFGGVPEPDGSLRAALAYLALGPSSDLKYTNCVELLQKAHPDNYFVRLCRASSYTTLSAKQVNTPGLVEKNLKLAARELEALTTSYPNRATPFGRLALLLKDKDRAKSRRLAIKYSQLETRPFKRKAVQYVLDETK